MKLIVKTKKAERQQPRNSGKEKWSPKLSSGDDILIKKITTRPVEYSDDFNLEVPQKFFSDQEENFYEACYL
jgi:hypothetical protein